MNLIYIFIGGGLGSLARYGLGKFIHSHYAGLFPLATFTINVLASFLVGLFLGWLSSRFPAAFSLKLFLAVGFCGGFSTFSTFSLESVELLKSGNYLPAFAYMFTSLLFCLLATFGGLALTKS